MAFKVFVAGEVLTAANVNDYLMEQVVIVCTSASRPSSPAEGWTIYETDTNRQLTYDGSGWVIGLEYDTWTDYSGSLAWTGSGSNPAIGNGTITARYRRSGKMVVFQFRILMGSTTTYGTGNYSISLPVTAASRFQVGSAYLRDSSATSNGHAPGITYIDSSTPTVCNSTSSTGTGTGSIVGTTAPFTWANGDYWVGGITYETT